MDIYERLRSMVYVSRLYAQGTAITDDDQRIRASGLYEDWQAGSYQVGDIRNAVGQTWECFQAHDNAVYPDIAPDNSAWFTFWRPLHGKSPDTARPFVPVQGAHVNESGADGGSGNVYDGKGQGTTTTFAGVMYSSAGGGAAYAISDSSDVPSQEAETPGATGAGAGHVNANGGAGTTKGAGGGGAVSTSSTNFRSGAGAAGRVIIEVA